MKFYGVGLFYYDSYEICPDIFDNKQDAEAYRQRKAREDDDISEREGWKVIEFTWWRSYRQWKKWKNVPKIQAAKLNEIEGH